MKLTYLAFMISPAAAHTVRKHLAKPFDRLALPCADLVRMNLVLRGNLLQRPVAPKRFQCQSSLSNHQKTCISSSSHIPPQSVGYTLRIFPIFRIHLIDRSNLNIHVC